MSDLPAPRMGFELRSASGLCAECHASGGLRRLLWGSTCVSLWVGSELEAGPTQIYLRHRGEALSWTPLLGATSPTRFQRVGEGELAGEGHWRDIEYVLVLRLAQDAPAWFWHLWLRNRSPHPQSVDLTYAQDVALAPYWALRLNEYYVSQYVDHTPLTHATQGTVVASRQNLPAEGRHPWCLLGSLRRGESFATDALQLHGLARRGARAPPGLAGPLPGRLQHEHSLVVIRETPLDLSPEAETCTGFFGMLQADHPEASTSADLAQVETVRALPESAPGPRPVPSSALKPLPSLFEVASPLPVSDLTDSQLQGLWSPPWRHEERDVQGRLLSFFQGAQRHVVLRTKEGMVLRPHGHLLRTGRHLTPDETALTSTAWMSGVFHSMLTQGHVSFNRMLSTTHSYLDLFRSHGLRVFVELSGAWWLLHLPSAFEMTPEGCRWIYLHERQEPASADPPAPVWIEVTAQAHADPQELTLSLASCEGVRPRWLLCLNLAVNGDDGCAPGQAQWSLEAEEIRIAPAAGSELARRFPQGSFRVHLSPGSHAALQQIGGDELLFADGASRGESCLCLLTQPVGTFELGIRGALMPVPPAQDPAPLYLESSAQLTPDLSVQASGPLAAEVSRLAELAPWLAHDALVHYLSPRGLEQYTGGGWGTRDVCQGPVELLLATASLPPLRDLLLRVMAQQNPDGDWPQWFMFFARDRAIRAGDSHGDIVLWPLVALGQYLAASGDGTILEEEVPYFAEADGERGRVWDHVQRALSRASSRTLPGTSLIAYGHGDWNDSLQPADPRLREWMCSSWMVTLHHQALMGLAAGLYAVGGKSAEAAALTLQAAQIRADFQRLLVVDEVLAGYAIFEPGQTVRYLLHPRDTTSGVHYSQLAMSHAILQDMFTPAQAALHLHLVEAHLRGPDGVRLFDRPLPYRGGPSQIFQRAESASFFGREIGLMYTHAHLRHAQALAHAGDAEGFFEGLCLSNPIAIRERVPTARLRQSNCYYSSSDAAFKDRYQAQAEYDRIRQRTVELEGGWRVYSSGAGILLALIRQSFLGLSLTAEALRVDPVMPARLDGLRYNTSLLGHPLEVRYRVGPLGCGVRRVVLNGKALVFQRQPNLYRSGAVLLSQRMLRGQLGQRNVLVIELG